MAASQYASLGSPSGEPDLRRNENTIFYGRFPDPAEILQWGGVPGVKYLMVPAENVQKARQEPPITIAGKEYRWGTTKGTDFYTIVGPRGECTMVVLSRGKPIPGADPANGIREWVYDGDLLKLTGLKSPYGGEDAEQIAQAAADHASGSQGPDLRQEGGDSAEGGQEVRPGRQTKGK